MLGTDQQSASYRLGMFELQLEDAEKYDASDYVIAWACLSCNHDLISNARYVSEVIAWACLSCNALLKDRLDLMTKLSLGHV